MMNDAELELLNRWSETTDKEEFVRLGLQLSPESTREELEDTFDLSMAGYTRRKLTPAEQKMLDDAAVDAHNHFLKLCDDMAIEMANERQRK